MYVQHNKGPKLSAKSRYFDIKMTENIKFLTPLQIKQVPYAYLNQVYT